MIPWWAPCWCRLAVVKYERWWYEAAPGSEFVDAVAILKVLHQACQCADSALVGAADIRRSTRLGFEEMETLLDKMVQQGWVGRVNVDGAVRVQWGKRVADSSNTGSCWATSTASAWPMSIVYSSSAACA